MPERPPYPRYLFEFPYVEVRIDCIYCKRAGRYRLAKLAARYGAEIEMAELRKAIAADCRWIDMRPQKYGARCGARFTDIDGGTYPQPPADLPETSPGTDEAPGVSVP